MKCLVVAMTGSETEDAEALCAVAGGSIAGGGMSMDDHRLVYVYRLGYRHMVGLGNMERHGNRLRDSDRMWHGHRHVHGYANRVWHWTFHGVRYSLLHGNGVGLGYVNWVGSVHSDRYWHLHGIGYFPFNGDGVGMRHWNLDVLGDDLGVHSVFYYWYSVLYDGHSMLYNGQSVAVVEVSTVKAQT